MPFTGAARKLFNSFGAAFLCACIAAFMLWGSLSCAHAQAYNAGWYTLNTSGRTLLQWKGNTAIVNLAADPVLARIDSIAPYAFLSKDSTGKYVPDFTIEQIIFPPKLKWVGRYAIWSKNLKYLRLNDGLETIEPFSIAEAALEEVHFPASLQQAQGAFYRCPYLDRLQVLNNSPFYTVEDGMLVNMPNQRLDLYPTGWVYQSPTLPSDITAIGCRAFFGNSFVQHLNIPEGVVDVGKEAFAYCNSLTTIQFPSTLRTLHRSAISMSPVDTLIFLSPFPVQWVDDGPAKILKRPRVVAVPDDAITMYSANSQMQQISQVIIPISQLPQMASSQAEPPPFVIVDRDLILNLPPTATQARLFDKEGNLKAIYTHTGTYTLAPDIYLLQIEDKTYKIVISNLPVH